MGHFTPRSLEPSATPVAPQADVVVAADDQIQPHADNQAQPTQMTGTDEVQVLDDAVPWNNIRKGASRAQVLEANQGNENIRQGQSLQSLDHAETSHDVPGEGQGCT